MKRSESSKSDLAKLSGSQKGRLALEALVASIPYLGPALQTAVFTRLNEKRFARLEGLFEELNDRFAKLGSNPELISYITSHLEDDEGFIIFVRRCIEQIANEHEMAKLNAYKEAFVNGFTNLQLTVNVKLAFLRMLDRVGTIELQILGFMAKSPPNDYIAASEIMTAVPNVSEQEKSLLLSAIDTLANLQFMEVGKVGLDADGKLHRERHNYRLTSLAHSFIQFIGADDVANQTNTRATTS